MFYFCVLPASRSKKITKLLEKVTRVLMIMKFSLYLPFHFRVSSVFISEVFSLHPQNLLFQVFSKKKTRCKKEIGGNSELIMLSSTILKEKDNEVSLVWAMSEELVT